MSNRRFAKIHSIFLFFQLCFVWACLIAICDIAFAQENAIGSRITNIESRPAKLAIHVKDIEKRRLVFILADEARMDVVIGDQLGRERISIDEPAIAVIPMIQRLAAEQNLGLRAENNMLMVASECRLSNPQSLYRSIKGQQKLILNFEDVRAGAIASADGILMREDEAPYNTSAVASDATISIRMRERTVREIADAMSTVLGWTPEPYAENGVQFAPGKEAADCASHANPAEKPGITTSRTEDVVRSCPDYLHDSERCDPLEKYQMGELKPLGYIQWQGQPARFALIEAVDGVVYKVRVGNYIGPDMGQIKSISDKAIKITERARNSNGEWVNKTTTMKMP